MSMRTAERRGKQTACTLINQMCEVHVRGLSNAEDQCECLIGAIIVCIYIIIIMFSVIILFVFCVLCSVIVFIALFFRMEIPIQYGTRLG